MLKHAILTTAVFLCCTPAVVYSQAEVLRGMTADDLLAVRDIKAMALSPDGQYVAYQVAQADKDRNGYTFSWYVAATAANVEPVLVADSVEVGLSTISNGFKVGYLYTSEIVWSPDSKTIAYTMKKDSEVQLWLSRRDRFGSEQLTRNNGDVERPKYGGDNSKLFFAVGRDRADMIEANSDQARQGYLAQTPPVYTVEMGPLWLPCSDGQERWGPEANDVLACEWSIWAVDTRTGIERKATEKEINAYYAGGYNSSNSHSSLYKLKDRARFLEARSLNEGRAAWFENEDPAVFKGVLPPMRVMADVGGDIFRCPKEVCKSERPKGLWWSPNGKEIIFMVSNGPRNTLNSLYAWTPGASDVRAILSNDDRFYNCSISGERLVCGHETWISPHKIVSVDLSDGSTSTIVDVNPEFQNFRFTKIEKIVGEDDNGNKAHAHLVYPDAYQNGKRYPLVIVQYRSGGFLRGGVGDEQPIHVLAQNGFMVLGFDTPDGDYNSKEEDDIEMQAAYLKYTMVEHGPASAIERMVDSLVSQGIVDPDRVGITGLSHGATTLDTALLDRNYAAASAAYSIMAPPNFRHSSFSRWGKAMAAAFGGTPYSEAGFLSRAKNSIGVNAGRIDTPFLIQVADREYYTTIDNYHALKEAGKPVEMHIFPDEYHVKYQPAHRYVVYNRNVDWLNFWLRGVEDPDPVKTDQYVRWRKLREQHIANLKVSGKDDTLSASESNTVH